MYGGAPDMSTPTPTPICPTCDAPLGPESHRWRPFCSERCKLVDLSRWLSEEYRVPGDPMGDGAVRRHDDEDDA